MIKPFTHLVRSKWYILSHNDGHGIESNNFVQFVPNVVRVNPGFVSTVCIRQSRSPPISETLWDVC